VSHSVKVRTVAERALKILRHLVDKRRAVLVTYSQELELQTRGEAADEDVILLLLAAHLHKLVPLVKTHVLQSSQSTLPGYLKRCKLNSHIKHFDNYGKFLENTFGEVRHAAHLSTVRKLSSPRPSRKIADKILCEEANPIKASLLYRPVGGIVDKVAPQNRHLRVGFAQGRKGHDMRGIGLYTPDHPQPARPKSARQ